jgi:hypothetical protein
MKSALDFSKSFRHSAVAVYINGAKPGEIILGFLDETLSVKSHVILDPDDALVILEAMSEALVDVVKKPKPEEIN